MVSSSIRLKVCPFKKVTYLWESPKEKYKRYLLFSQKHYERVCKDLGIFPIHSVLTFPVVYLPCNKCVACQLKSSNNWALRLLMETQAHKDICFITLTYNNENLPYNASLYKRDYQLFIKRLRKALNGLKIRYFLSGEYGSLYGRPHYHLILFGWKPTDLVERFTRTKKGEVLYESNFLAKLWGYGFISVGLNTEIRTFKYLAKYMQKIHNDDYQLIQSGRIPTFIVMSKGIGKNYYNKDIYFKDDGIIYLDGKSYKAPSYFDRLFKKTNLEDFQRVRSLRLDNDFLDFQEVRFVHIQNYLAYCDKVRLSFHHLGKVLFDTSSSLLDPIKFKYRKFLGYLKDFDRIGSIKIINERLGFWDGRQKRYQSRC